MKPDSCSTYELENSRKSSIFAICFNVPFLLIFIMIVKYVRIKTKLLQDPLMNYNYNMLTMRMYQTIFFVSIIRIVKAIVVLIYSMNNLAEIYNYNCYNYGLLTTFLQANVVVTYIELTFDMVIKYLMTVELLFLCMIIIREKKSTLPELYFMS